MNSLYTHTYCVIRSVSLCFFWYLHHDFYFDFTLPWVNSNLSFVFYPYLVDLSHDLYDLLLIPDFHYIELHHDSTLIWIFWLTIGILSLLYWITCRFMWLISSSEWSCTNMKWQQFIHAYKWYIFVVLTFVWLDSLSNTL